MSQPQVTKAIATEVRDGCYVIEASDLGLARLPRSLTTDIGDGTPFVFRCDERDGEGELLCHVFRQLSTSIKLEVLND